LSLGLCRSVAFTGTAIDSKVLQSNRDTPYYASRHSLCQDSVFAGGMLLSRGFVTQKVSGPRRAMYKFSVGGDFKALRHGLFRLLHRMASYIFYFLVKTFLHGKKFYAIENRHFLPPGVVYFLQECFFVVML
jgi:hypothetical protein